jgi:very-short-patch-repair endonuclease
MQKTNDACVLNGLQKIEWVFAFTANGNQLILESQKEFKYYHYDGTVKSICADFYYEDETGAIKVAIECDDISNKNRLEEDELRDKTLEMQGIKVFRFNTKEISWNCLKCVNEVKAYIMEQKDFLKEVSYNRKFEEADGGKISIRIN